LLPPLPLPLPLVFASSSSLPANLKLPHAVKVKIHNFTPSSANSVVNILPKEAIKMASQLRGGKLATPVQHRARRRWWQTANATPIPNALACSFPSPFLPLH